MGSLTSFLTDRLILEPGIYLKLPRSPTCGCSRGSTVCAGYLPAGTPVEFRNSWAAQPCISLLHVYTVQVRQTLNLWLPPLFGWSRNRVFTSSFRDRRTVAALRFHCMCWVFTVWHTSSWVTESCVSCLHTYTHTHALTRPFPLCITDT